MEEGQIDQADVPLSTTPELTSAESHNAREKTLATPAVRRIAQENNVSNCLLCTCGHSSSL